MAEGRQELLRAAWLGGVHGHLSAMAEARAWSLREVYVEMGKPKYGLNTFVASRLTKVGGGAPGVSAVIKFFARLDADDEWFPGKSSRTEYGPQGALSETAKNNIASSAMAMKDRKVEPTYKKVLSTCPQAVINPETGKAVDKRLVYDVLRERCYDDPEDQEDTWEHQARLTKSALPDSVQVKRKGWADAVDNLDLSPQWCYWKLLWTDLCNSILPLSEKVASEQALARKGGKGWMSKKCTKYSKNVKGKKESLKQKSWDTIRIWWAPFLSRGKLHVEVFDADFPGETPAGAAKLVAKARAFVNIRFRNAAAPPEELYVDRGKGFYNAGNGKITAEFKGALQQHGLTAFWGNDASKQPGNLQEVHLHETAVSWIRHRLTLTTPANAEKETRQQYTRRLKSVVADINNKLDVEGLCWALPKRVKMVQDARGDLIKP